MLHVVCCMTSMQHAVVYVYQNLGLIFMSLNDAVNELVQSNPYLTRESKPDTVQIYGALLRLLY